MTAQEVAAALPDIDTLQRRCRAVAMLDAILLFAHAAHRQAVGRRRVRGVVDQGACRGVCRHPGGSQGGVELRAGQQHRIEVRRDSAASPGTSCPATVAVAQPVTVAAAVALTATIAQPRRFNALR